MAQERIVSRRAFTLTWISFVVGATAGALTTLGSYARSEIRRRGYPLWSNCKCDFKASPTIFQVWGSQHEQRGETIYTEEWGLNLSNPPQWLRRFLHDSAQVLAALNPIGNYVERVTLSPQEARQLAFLLHATSAEEDQEEEESSPFTHIVWRSEVLYTPHHLFDKCIRRIYPAHLPQERIANAQPLPTLWDPQTNLPLPTEGRLLETPTGTRIDCIGWASSQISYCTARTGDTE
ncbi:MAG TPA: hypothetical protein VFK47_05145 [Ktedonobacteraceae bacterium]|nr:hypothetical protein [Ktedonobacteraceae bacterium]